MTQLIWRHMASICRNVLSTSHISSDWFTHIRQGRFTGTGWTVWLSTWSWHQIRQPHIREYEAGESGANFTLVSLSKVHGANMGPIWGRHDLGGPHVGPMKFAILVITPVHVKFIGSIWLQLVILNYNKTQQIVIHLHNSWKEFMCCSGKVAVFDISRGFISGLNIIFFIQLISLEAKMVDLPDDSHWNWELLWCQLLHRWRI